MQHHLGTLLAFSVLSFTAPAQDTGFLSGTFSIATTSSDVGGIEDLSTTNITVGPLVGINLNEKIVVGAGLTYTYNTRMLEDEFIAPNGIVTTKIKHTASLFKVLPFMRYMKKVDENFQLYGQLKAGVGFGSTRYEAENGSDSETTLSTFEAGVGPGIMYGFAPHWAINADWGLLGYNSMTEKTDGGGKETTSGLDFRLNPGAITFGLNWLF